MSIEFLIHILEIWGKRISIVPDDPACLKVKLMQTINYLLLMSFEVQEYQNDCIVKISGYLIFLV